MLFMFLGKILFPRQQDWERERNAKTLAAAVCVGLTMAGAIAWFILKRGGIGK